MQIAKRIYTAVLDLLFPPKCIYCGKLTDYNICEECYKNLSFVNNPDTKTVLGAVCYSAVKYQGNVRESFHDYKFNGKSSYASGYGRLMYKVLEENSQLKEADYISFVPLSKQRLKKRGYNQAKLLADELSRLSGIPVVNTLKKCKNTGANSGISDHSQRRSNVSGVYECAGDLSFLDNKTLILIDDVVTSGSTLSECVSTLKQNTNAKIICMTYARA